MDLGCQGNQGHYLAPSTLHRHVAEAGVAENWNLENTVWNSA